VPETSEPVVAEVVCGHLIGSQGIASLHYQHFQAGKSQNISRRSSPSSGADDDHVIAIAHLPMGRHDGREPAL
jgi:hypothetical protein